MTNKPASKSPSDSLSDAVEGRINQKLIDNVEVALEAYLGHARLTVGELSSLRKDALIPLDASLDRAVELRLNGVTVASGELVSIGDRFGIRLVEIAK